MTNNKYQIKLTTEEFTLYQIVVHSLGKGIGTPAEERQEIAEAEYKLTMLLIERGVIPRARIEYLTDPGLNIGTNYSRLGVFQKNGTKGTNVFRHAHFIPYLRYLIDGPNLPKSTLENFEEFVNTQPAFEAEDLREARALVKREVRENNLDPKQACEEFYKLAYESGLGKDFARALRDEVHRMR